MGRIEGFRINGFRGWIVFRWGAKDGRDIPVYNRKAYRKARWKKKSERLAPGYWEQNVKQSFEQWAEKQEEK